MKEKIERSKFRPNTVKYLIYPEYSKKINWDLYLTALLLIQLSITPYRIAFYDNDDVLEMLFNNMCDALFFIDIFVIFNSAYYDEDFVLVDDRKKIASNYIQSWLIIDIVSITPFDKLF